MAEMALGLMLFPVVEYDTLASIWEKGLDEIASRLLQKWVKCRPTLKLGLNSPLYSDHYSPLFFSVTSLRGVWTREQADITWHEEVEIHICLLMPNYKLLMTINLFTNQYQCNNIYIFLSSLYRPTYNIQHWLKWSSNPEKDISTQVRKHKIMTDSWDKVQSTWCLF